MDLALRFAVNGRYWLGGIGDQQHSLQVQYRYVLVQLHVPPRWPFFLTRPRVGRKHCKGWGHEEAGDGGEGPPELGHLLQGNTTQG